MKFDTRLVRFDQCPGDPYRPVATPIYQTATFEQELATEFGEYDYSRSGNPTRSVLERQLADLENASRAFAFSSGMAAIAAIARLLRPGDEILAGGDLYGGAYRLFSKILQHSGIEVRYTCGPLLEDFSSQLTTRTRMIHIETPGNPLLSITSISAIAELAHSAGALLSVDNSMLSPYLQNPLDHGADIVVHSATKFLCGHSDVTAGVAAVNSSELAERIYLIQNGEGTALGPFDSFLLLRGLKTLSLRINRQQESALSIIDFLRQPPSVKRIFHPSLADEGSRAIHCAQARGDGSILAFETGDVELSRKVVEATRIFAITVSFGSVNSSISLPHCMSHASVPPQVRKLCRFPEDLVRLSVGIEDPEDLIADLDRALSGGATNDKSVPVAVGASAESL